MMWPSHASSGKGRKFSIYILPDYIVCPSGNPTLMGVPMFVDGLFGASIC